MQQNGSVAQLNRASDSGSAGHGFESHPSHYLQEKTRLPNSLSVHFRAATSSPSILFPPTHILKTFIPARQAAESTIMDSIDDTIHQANFNFVTQNSFPEPNKITWIRLISLGPISGKGLNEHFNINRTPRVRHSGPEGCEASYPMGYGLAFVCHSAIMPIKKGDVISSNSR